MTRSYVPMSSDGNSFENRYFSFIFIPKTVTVHCLVTIVVFFIYSDKNAI